MQEYQQNPTDSILHGQVRPTGGTTPPAPAAFLETVQIRLSNVRENILRATNTLAEAGFYNDAKTGSTDQAALPDNKRAQIIAALVELETLAITLVEQVNKLA
jgi:hypothetical protein